ncbi:MAG: flagellar biosynthetic protein FliO [Hyphomonadaceae bacterium]|jgi:flagellar protein FliO/FliZ|nr:flagellar biosynthetic protein FliO [Hyphomonadaceae bacterium]
MDESNLFLDGLRAVFALALTLGLLVGAAWLARRYGLMQGGVTAPGTLKRMALVEQLWLDAGRSRLMIVRIDGKEHVMLVTPTGAVPITGTDATPTQTSGQPT